MSQPSWIPAELDGRVVRSLWMLSDGNVEKFLNFNQPTGDIRDYIRQARLSQLNGILIETLRALASQE
ncbi:MAG: hypothetical protein IID45_04005 [Planctomycetes bacterium]|nr:hypothetical protein [Planctomycetota bacterium]